MKPIASLAAVSLLAIAACVPRPQPAPPVQIRPTPAPAPAPPPAPAPANWLDAPQTPGEWRYVNDGGIDYAVFGEPGQLERLRLWCDTRTREVALNTPGSVESQANMILRTETQTRALRTTPMMYSSPHIPVVEARIRAADGLLDAMALSKGRFAIEVPGSATLYVPSWAEVTRVIEDCR